MFYFDVTIIKLRNNLGVETNCMFEFYCDVYRHFIKKHAFSKGYDLGAHKEK